MGKVKKGQLMVMCVLFVLSLGMLPAMSEAEQQEVKLHSIKQMEEITRELPKFVPRFMYDSGLSFAYPDAVRGLYVTGHVAGGYKNYLEHLEDNSKSLYTTGKKFKEIIDLIDSSALNAVVIDVKDDFGYITYLPDESSSLSPYGKPYIKDMRELLEFLEEKQIYPIARIVVFKDTVWGKERPDVSFTQNGKLWTNNNGEAFVNPFLKEVWERNIELAIDAAKLGFKEIQFDYVRFPEGFETRDKALTYSLGEYESIEMDDVQKRVQAVTDFVKYAKEKLSPFNVDVSVDIFGYTATLPEAPGIGQNFLKIAEHVDVISSMIYPSHWGFHYFNIPEPDKDPYKLVLEYAKIETEKLAQLANPPISRPWLQDFEAPWLYKYRGLPTKEYGKQEVEAQIKALNEQGITEFLLWNAANVYTKNVDYTPLETN